MGDRDDVARKKHAADAASDNFKAATPSEWRAASAEQRAVEHQRMIAFIEEKYKDKLDAARKSESKKAFKKLLHSLLRSEIRIANKATASKRGNDWRGEHEKQQKRKREDIGNDLQARLNHKKARILLRQATSKVVSRGPRVAVDFSFARDNAVATKQRKSLLTQMSEIHHHNTVAAQPSRVVLCGFPDSFREDMKKRFAYETWEAQRTFSIVKQDLFDVAPQSDIVYLSSEAPQDLEAVIADKTYVIGGILDRNGHKGATQAKAEELKVASRRLPLNAYLARRRRPLTTKKVLTCNAVAQILFDVKATGDWDYALDRNLPFRGGDKKSNFMSSNADKDDDDIEQGTKTCLVSWINPACAKPKVALVLGASSGLGFEFARQLRKRGWTVVMVARETKKLDSAAQELRKQASKSRDSSLSPLVVTIPGDCSDRADCLRIARALNEMDIGTAVDGVVACSGTFKWDTDKDVMSDPDLLHKSNFLSKAIAIQEMFPLLNIDLNFYGGINNPFEFRIAPYGMRDAEKLLPEKMSNRTKQNKGFILCVGSDAGKPDFHERVKDTENEEKYIQSMQNVSKWFGLFQAQLGPLAPSMQLKLVEPPLVATEMAKREFEILPIDWATVPTPQDYVEEIITQELNL